MTRQEALGRLLELEDYFCRRFADAPMESEEEAEAYKHARAVKEAIMLLSQEEADAENLSAAAAASPLSGETRGEAAGWISVEDRLPEEYTHVLVCKEYSVDYPEDGVFDVKESLVREGYWSRGVDAESRGWRLCIRPDVAKWPISGVTHWMPLPEMPEEYKNEID